jgi:hypothetical protein
VGNWSKWPELRRGNTQKQINFEGESQQLTGETDRMEAIEKKEKAAI